MQSLKRLIPLSSVLSTRLSRHQDKLFLLTSQHLAPGSSSRFLDICQDSADEMNRGYFAHMSELKEHGGKNNFIRNTSADCNGKTMKLPITSNGDMVGADRSAIPKASLICLSFRANSQAMIDSWSGPCLDAYRNKDDVQLYEVSFIDSWFLCWNSVKQPLIWVMKKSNYGGKDALQKQIVYSFGDHYYF